MKWRCVLCGIFATMFLGSLMQHIRQQHSSDSNLLIPCSVDNCPQRFTKYKSYYRHVRRHHDRHLQNSTEEQMLIQQQQKHQSQPEAMDGDEDPDTPEVDIAVDEHQKSSRMEARVDLKKKAAAFILKMKAECRLTQKSTEKIVEGVRSMTSCCLERTKQQLLERLEEGNGLTRNDVETIFETAAANDPFEELETEYFQMKFFRENFNLIDPVRKILGKKVAVTGKGCKRKLKEVEHTFYYIPVLRLLSALMQNDLFREEVLADRLTDDGTLITDYRDAVNFKQHDFFSRHPKAMQIILYYDDVELCNPLGSKIKTHKVGFFYYTLANIHPQYRSKLSSINLLCACPTRYLSQDSYGIDAVLREFVEEMKQLADGVQITMGDMVHEVHGAVISFVADTLAAHQVGGFKEGVGFSLRKCRHCMISTKDMDRLFDCSDFEMRTLEKHEKICKKIETAPTIELRDTFSTTYGVNRKSILCELPYFNIFDGMPEDIMHIVLEGCLPYTLKHMLKEYVQKLNLFSVSHLNHRIQGFNFGYIDSKDKPSVIPTTVLDDGGSFRQSAVQMWTLGRFIPLIIGDLVDTKADIWQCFILLLQIMLVCFSPVIQKEDIAYLKDIIYYYLQLFKSCFKVNIIPKQHYLCHFPEQLLKLGPLVRFWSMRFEAKHSYFKSLCSIASYKNICCYMAKRNQLTVANDLLDIHGNSKPHPMFDKDIEWGPCSELEDQQYAKLELQRSGMMLENEHDTIFESSWVRMNGSLFKPGCFVVSQFEDGLPVFAEVKKLWSANKVPIVRLVVYDTVAFDEIYIAFEVEIPLVAAALETKVLTMLDVCEAFNIYKCKEQFFIVPKYDLRMCSPYE